MNIRHVVMYQLRPIIRSYYELLWIHVRLRIARQCCAVCFPYCSISLCGLNPHLSLHMAFHRGRAALGSSSSVRPNYSIHDHLRCSSFDHNTQHVRIRRGCCHQYTMETDTMGTRPSRYAVSQSALSRECTQRVHRCDNEELESLMKELCANKMVPPSTIDAIEQHADALGRSICGYFEILHTIMVRHESLIRKR